VCSKGKCAAPAKAGDPCTEPLACDLLHGLVCTKGTCAPVERAADGATCGFVDGAVKTCTGSATCPTIGPLPTANCAARAADGERCFPSPLGASCMAPAVCGDGFVCTPPDPSRCK
jgi:hypothetical protein